MTEKNAGMYKVYQFFLAAAVLTGLLGLVCIALLIYYYVQSRNNDEMVPLNNRRYVYADDDAGYGLNDPRGPPGGNQF